MESRAVVQDLVERMGSAAGRGKHDGNPFSLPMQAVHPKAKLYGQNKEPRKACNAWNGAPAG